MEEGEESHSFYKIDADRRGNTAGRLPALVKPVASQVAPKAEESRAKASRESRNVSSKGSQRSKVKGGALSTEGAAEKVCILL